MKRAGAHVLKRLLWAAVLVVGVGSISFVIARTLPGDPVRMLVGPQARQADIDAARRIYGLDRSILVQYTRFWQRLLHRATSGSDHESCSPIGSWHVDMGFSYRSKKGVAELIAERAPRSLKLAAFGIAIQMIIGLAVGAFAARRRDELGDRLSIALVLILVSAPIFVLGVTLQYLFGHRLGWLPLDASKMDLASMVLPALTLGTYGAALYARLTREELSQALAADYVRTARAKGASERYALWVHALRNAMLPITTLMVLDFGALVGGAIVTEKLFRWPGLGALTVDAVVNRDAPVIFGTVMVSAAAIAVATLAIDVLALWLDPRLRR
jgi:peptide/nickel transport system permease protein